MQLCSSFGYLMNHKQLTQDLQILHKQQTNCYDKGTGKEFKKSAHVFC